MIWVLEHWYFKPDLADPTAVMQEMDDLLGPAAHEHPGWCGHARFFARLSDPADGIMLYPWRSLELHEDLARAEEPKLVEFYQRYCAKPRDITYYTELEVDVEDHDHEDHDHEPAATP